MRSAWWVGILVMVAACHRQPAPVLEYGETVTYTSTADDSAPQRVPAAQAATDVAASPSPAAAAPPPSAAPAPSADEAQSDPVTTTGGEWTTTVHTGDVQSVSAPSEPLDVAPAPVADTPPDDAPPPSGSERLAPRQWYKAKPW